MISPNEPWDWFVFNDRDFTSVAELMLVPGCPPGLFTKQFVELPPMVPSTTATARSLRAYSTSPWARRPPIPRHHGYLPPQLDCRPSYPMPRSRPQRPCATPRALQHRHGDSAAHVSRTSSTSSSIREARCGPTSSAYRYVAGFAATDVPVGQTAASDGWFKMFEFFEVPSQMIGAIGPVAQGTNFDWSRQDNKPGLMNLNLVIDEEVFLALLGRQTIQSSTTPGSRPVHSDILEFHPAHDRQR